jgi:hypothetical protein
MKGLLASDRVSPPAPRVTRRTGCRRTTAADVCAGAFSPWLACRCRRHSEAYADRLPRDSVTVTESTTLLQLLRPRIGKAAAIADHRPGCCARSPPLTQMAQVGGLSQPCGKLPTSPLVLAGIVGEMRARRRRSCPRRLAAKLPQGQMEGRDVSKLPHAGWLRTRVGRT